MCPLSQKKKYIYKNPQVNSDVHYLTRDKYGNVVSVYVDTTLVGRGLFTKHILADTPDEVTSTYKHPEGDGVSIATAGTSPGPTLMSARTCVCVCRKSR